MPPTLRSQYTTSNMLRAAATVALFAIIAFTFWRAIANAPVWDDADLTTKNPFVQSLAGLAEIVTTDIWTASAKAEPSSFYRPLAMASYVLNRAAFGNSAASYHGANIALHAVNAWLLGLLLRRQSRALRPSAIALPVLWFAVAPVNVEAVAWIAGRFDLVGTGFVIAALAANVGTSRASRLATAALVVASVFCKEAFVTSFVLLALHDALVLRRRLRDELVKYALCAAGLAAFFLCRWLVGVMSVAAVAATDATALLQSYAFLLETFARTLFYPLTLEQYRAYRAPSALATAAILAIAGSVVVGLAALLHARPNDTRVRPFAFGLVWVLVAFAPASLTGPNLDMVGDRYAYYPLVGFFIALAMAVDAALPPRRATAVGAGAVAIACLAVFVHRSRVRLLDWRDERTLDAASVRDDPANAYALYALGYFDALDDRTASADDLLARSIAIQPRSWRTLNALCFVRLHQKRPAEAEELCLRSVAIHSSNPRAWINLASARVNLRKWDAGADAAGHAVALKPQSAEARYLRAACLANLGDLDAARDELGKALEIEPTHAGARDLLAQFHARGLP